MSQYATIADLYRFGFREEARGDLVDSVLDEHLIAASQVIDGHLGQRYGQPLATWTNEVRVWTVKLALYGVMTGPRGMGSDSPDYTSLRAGYDDTLSMLRRVQRQDYTPVGLVPVAAPSSSIATQPQVISATARGW